MAKDLVTMPGSRQQAEQEGPWSDDDREATAYTTPELFVVGTLRHMQGRDGVRYDDRVFCRYYN